VTDRTSMGSNLSLTRKVTLGDNFRTFEWPRASDLKELVMGSRV